MRVRHRSKSHAIQVQIDRVQLCSWAPQGRPPPALEGFAITRDSFVRRQTTTATYARCRQYKSLVDDTKIYWQYERQKSWLRPWKITIVADDSTGLSYGDIENVLRHCKFYKFLTVEVAIDFSPDTGVNRRFVRRHATFGKSRRVHRNKKSPLYWGARKSDKLVRCYPKEALDNYRMELELHSQLLRREQISTLDDFDGLPDSIYPRHFQFVDVDWVRLKQCLSRKRDGHDLIAGAQVRAASLSRLRRYLRKHGVANFHRFLTPLALNERVDRALTRWMRDFDSVA